MENKIGDFQFISLSQPPQPVLERLEILARPGVNGVAIRKTGRRGEPFPLVSTVDHRSLQAAIDEIKKYARLVDDDPVSVTWSGIGLDAMGIKCQVLAVRPLRLSGLATAVGGLNPPSRALLVCVWDLLPIDTDDQAE